MTTIQLKRQFDYSRLYPTYPGNGFTIYSSADPVQDSAVFTESRPQELVVLFSLPEPIDVENLWQLHIRFLLEVKPMLQIVSEVVAEEGSHRERVVHYHFAFVLGGGGGF